MDALAATKQYEASEGHNLATISNAILMGLASPEEIQEALAIAQSTKPNSNYCKLLSAFLRQRLIRNGKLKEAALIYGGTRDVNVGHSLNKFLVRSTSLNLNFASGHYHISTTHPRVSEHYEEEPLKQFHDTAKSVYDYLHAQFTGDIIEQHILYQLLYQYKLLTKSELNNSLSDNYTAEQITEGIHWLNQEYLHNAGLAIYERNGFVALGTADGTILFFDCDDELIAEQRNQLEPPFNGTESDARYEYLNTLLEEYERAVDAILYDADTVDDPDNTSIENIPDIQTPSPEGGVIEKELIKTIYRKLRKTGESDRNVQIFWQHYYYGQRWIDIANHFLLSRSRPQQIGQTILRKVLLILKGMGLTSPIPKPSPTDPPQSPS